MSPKLRHIPLKAKHIIGGFALLALLTTGLAPLESCSWANQEDLGVDQHIARGEEERDPLPGELVMKTLMEDSIRNSQKLEIKKNMARIIGEYRSRFKEEYFNGYFLTDFNEDGLPELWIKVGNYRDNAKLELYYPMPDGTLRKSDVFAEPGQYFIGDNYMMQVVGSGPGVLNVNRISIRNGAMAVENLDQIDLYSNPQARIPSFKEKEIRDTSLGNLTTLNRAFLN